MQIVDALVLTLGIDSTSFTKGQKEAVASMAKLKDAADKGGKSVEASAKGMSESLGKATNGFLTLMAAFLGGKGLKEFVSDAIRTNNALGNLSTSLNVSSQFISAWDMAAERMGGSAAATQSSLQALSDSLINLNAKGKAPPTELFMLEAQSGKAIDLAHGLDAYTISLAAASHELAKTDPARAHNFLRALGIDPVTANLLIKQGDHMRSYLETMKRLAPSEKDVRTSSQLTDAWAHLNQQFGLLATKIMTAIGPALIVLADKIGMVVEAVAHWVEKNPEWTTAITGFIAVLSAGSILLAVKNVLGLASALRGLAAANALEGAAGGGLLGLLGRIGLLNPYVAGALAAGTVLNPGPTNETEDEIHRQRRTGQYRGDGDREQRGEGNEALRHRGRQGRQSYGKVSASGTAGIIDELRKAGLPDEAIAATLGSMSTESSFNTHAHNGVAGGHDGLIQWDSVRWPKIKAWIRSQGGDPYDARWQTRAYVAEGRAKPGDALYDTPQTQRGFQKLEQSKGNMPLAASGLRDIERFGYGEEGGRERKGYAFMPLVQSHSEPPKLDSSTVGTLPRYQAYPATGPNAYKGSGPLKPLPPIWTGSLDGARKSLQAGAPQSAALNNIANDYRATTSTTSNEANIQQINVHTQATDAHGIARTIDGALAQNLFATHANTGPN